MVSISRVFKIKAEEEHVSSGHDGKREAIQAGDRFSPAARRLYNLLKHVVSSPNRLHLRDGALGDGRYTHTGREEGHKVMWVVHVDTFRPWHRAPDSDNRDALEFAGMPKKR